MKIIPADKPIIGWWFGGDTLPHGDNRPVAIGTVHAVAPPIRACSVGLHCSVRALDALGYTNVCSLWRVEVWGECDDSQTDKLACQYRRYVWHGDVTALLRRFACRCALDVLPDDVPEVVRKYLQLADRATEAQRAAAYAAARAAARYAAYAAYDAAYAAARAAVYAVAYDAARAVARSSPSVRLEAMMRAEIRRCP